MNPYNKAIASWFSRKCPNRNINVDVVEKVEIIEDEGYHYSSYTFEDAHTDIIISGGVYPNDVYAEFSLSDLDVPLGQFVEEVVAIMNEAS